MEEKTEHSKQVIDIIINTLTGLKGMQKMLIKQLLKRACQINFEINYKELTVSFAFFSGAEKKPFLDKKFKLTDDLKAVIKQDSDNALYIIDESEIKEIVKKM